MRILTILTFYRPYTSGLTIYAERLARALAGSGHEVTVIASRHDRSLASEEVADGVRVLRVPVRARVSRGVLAPGLGRLARRELERHDLLHLHLPQFEAGALAAHARFRGKPVVLTYHSELVPSPGLVNRCASAAVRSSGRLAARLADRVVAYTEDLASHSAFLVRCGGRCEVIPPPVELPKAGPSAVSAFARRHGLDGRRVLGMASRFSSEKGIDVLLDALPAVFDRVPEATVLFAGPYRDVPGESGYLTRLRPRIRELEAAGRWTFLDVLSQEEMAVFMNNLDLLVVPSVNGTETFGLVQIEAMLCGTPVVAAGLPGVREPVRRTGMGRVVPVSEPGPLAEAVVACLEEPRPEAADWLREIYDPKLVAARYEAMFSSLVG